MRTAEIEHIISLSFIVGCRAHTLHDVINVSIVAPRLTLAILIDRQTFEKGPGELVDGEIRSLTRTIHGEKSQRNHSHAVQMRISGTQLLAGNLGCGIRTQRARQCGRFAERRLRRRPVNRGAAREKKTAHSGTPGRFKHIERPRHIGFEVKAGIGDRWPDAGPRRKMKHSVPAGCEHTLHFRRLANVGAMNVHRLAQGCHVALLDCRIVKIVEIVENADRPAVRVETPRGVRSDEARAAGNQYFPRRHEPLYLADPHRVRQPAPHRNETTIPHT